MVNNAAKVRLKKLPKGLKRVVRCLLIPPLRTYFRYAPFVCGKKTLWYAVAAHLWWLETCVKAKTFFGSVVRVDAGDIVGRYIYYFGIWEPDLTNWISQRLAPDDVFIDVGANIGYYSLLASQLVGEVGRVVAIEALPRTFRTLENNLQINRVRNVRTINVAAWDREESVKLFTQPENPPGTTTAMPEWASQWGLEAYCEVHGAPLSAILRADEIKAARLIKIDVEGAEWRVISGMASVLHACRRDLEIIVEVAPKLLAAEGRSCQDLLSLFGRHGFYPYRINNDYRATSYFQRTLSRPERIEEIPTVTDQTDVVFSRIDAPSL